MKKSLCKKKVELLIAIIALVCMGGISYAADTSKANTVTERAAVNQLYTAAGNNSECAKTPSSNLFAAGSLATMYAANKGRDGAACSSNAECVHVCEGGSCCTNYGDTCDANSHCCGHQSCTNGKCPN